MIESYEEVRKRIRFSIEEKIESLQSTGINLIEEDILDFDTLLKDNKFISPGVKGSKKQFYSIGVDALYELEYRNITMVSVVNMDSGQKYNEVSDYEIDHGFGLIHILPNGMIEDGTNIVVIFDSEETSYTKSYGTPVFIMHHKESKSEIKELQYRKKIELEYKQEHKIIDMFGWPYFDDVCYLDATQVKMFDKVMSLDFGAYNMRDYPKGTIFQQLNKISYYDLEIDRLELTQKRFNVTRIKREYPLEKTKKILETLRVIEDDHDAVEPLLQTLKDMGIDINKERLSYRKKIDYLVMESRGVPKQPRFNNDIFDNYKKDKKKEESALHNIFKLTKKNKYRDAARELLSRI